MDNRCWIIGNGKSLKKKHLEALAGETTFATNMISKIYDKTEWRPTHFTAVTTAIEMPQYRPYILRGISECDSAFVSEEAFYYLDSAPHAMPLDVDREHLFWSTDVYNKVSAWGMSHLVSFNLAIEEMQFDEIYLLGFDLGFEIPAKGTDPNHFCDDYWDMDFMRKRLKNDPMLLERTEKDHIITHKFIKEQVEGQDCRIFNCTFGGDLKVYPRRSMYKVLKGEYDDSI